ncbi:hypothetical protein Z517_09228 [Fonsecaea pedrosoi CBS 271.37]|uniref:Unplaced genomic scaffold supercont1.6, whole genome shotgun sequence n=1 Tax=Fonsecaea pedrosoi CBS 271.37 TaxID=1442368 RepID=A0A0D2GWP2_9EURO|nr:uncharacterized protein Z517_09228 [Fonsecaea pedrosoi CBS 271.37]KIW76784.1 hypothetical protein Z517_09228 [Fonsecaea pedrosoi CBS 271.37]
MDTTMYKTQIENSRPFTVRRMIKDGNIISGVPSVAKCVWTTIRTENLEVYEAKLEDAKMTKGCKGYVHEQEREDGHLLDPRAKFMYVSKDGSATCPVAPDVCSTGVPLEIYDKINTNFDDSEIWMLAPITLARIREVYYHWYKD